MRRKDLARRSVREKAVASLLLLGLLAAATSAQAVPVFFQGPFSGGLRFGIGEPPPGVGVLTAPDDFVELLSVLPEIEQTLDSGSVVLPPSPSFADPIRATSNWTVRLPGETSPFFLVFFAAEDYTQGSAGLDLIPAQGWSLVAATDDQTTFYYPAVGPFEGTGTATVNYLLAESLRMNPAGELLLPQWRVGVAIVPEPSAVVLLGVGLLGFAAARWRSWC